MLMIGIFIAAKVRGLPSQPWGGWGEVLAAARDALWGLLLIIIILGGIYGGIFTPTEAAAVSAVYAFLIANFVYRDMGPFKEPGPGGAISEIIDAGGAGPGAPLDWAHGIAIDADGAVWVAGNRSDNVFRIVLGPLGIADYLRMLPGGKSLHRLKAVVRNYLGDELEWELQLILRQQEIPRPRLDGKTHLGWTSWLSQQPLGRDGDDLHLHPCELRSQQQ